MYYTTLKNPGPSIKATLLHLFPAALCLGTEGEHQCTREASRASERRHGSFDVAYRRGQGFGFGFWPGLLCVVVVIVVAEVVMVINLGRSRSQPLWLESVQQHATAGMDELQLGFERLRQRLRLPRRDKSAGLCAACAALGWLCVWAAVFPVLNIGDLND